jgi:UDP-N-acetylmuramate dehydrogenase
MQLPELPFLVNEVLAKHTTYKIGGPARYLAMPESVAHLESLANYLNRSKESFAFMGNGSNLLVPDDGFDGWVIKTMALPQFMVPLPNHKLHVSAAMSNGKVLRACAELGLSGLEYLAGVPGTIGGAVWMNAGTGSGWIQNNIERVESFSFARGRQSYSNEQIRYAYREQGFLDHDEIILSAVFALAEEKAENITRQIGESIKKRKEAQPIEMPSCGSVFRNPKQMSAWQCIEKVGLRGYAIGNARFSQKHCNFIVNEGGATMQNVLDLIQLAKLKVMDELSIELVEEVVVLRAKKLA